jgi:hypothetical protein
MTIKAVIRSLPAKTRKLLTRNPASFTYPILITLSFLVIITNNLATNWASSITPNFIKTLFEENFLWAFTNLFYLSVIVFLFHIIIETVNQNESSQANAEVKSTNNYNQILKNNVIKPSIKFLAILISTFFLISLFSIMISAVNFNNQRLPAFHMSSSIESQITESNKRLSSIEVRLEEIEDKINESSLKLSRIEVLIEEINQNLSQITRNQTNNDNQKSEEIENEAKEVDKESDSYTLISDLCPNARDARWTDGYSFYEYIPHDPNQYGTIVRNSANVRRGIGFSQGVVATLSQGHKVLITGEAWDIGCNQWMQIRMGERGNYWVHGNSLSL